VRQDPLHGVEELEHMVRRIEKPKKIIMFKGEI
jgi:hypothetical protein